MRGKVVGGTGGVSLMLLIGAAVQFVENDKGTATVLVLAAAGVIVLGYVISHALRD